MCIRDRIRGAHARGCRNAVRRDRAHPGNFGRGRESQGAPRAVETRGGTRTACFRKHEPEEDPMIVTRDVVRDLLPVYLAGEASADTRRVVEDFLASDQGLAAEVAEAQRAELS